MFVLHASTFRYWQHTLASLSNNLPFSVWYDFHDTGYFSFLSHSFPHPNCRHSFPVHNSISKAPSHSSTSKHDPNTLIAHMYNIDNIFLKGSNQDVYLPGAGYIHQLPLASWHPDWIVSTPNWGVTSSSPLFWVVHRTHVKVLGMGIRADVGHQCTCSLSGVLSQKNAASIFIDAEPDSVLASRCTSKCWVT